ncbi:Uncharacterised protein [Actinomyces bovis]|uniref:Uncharacterized protein n=1 Tax=Actinomyces bovis TaxID=1658 RepID=A0ABY1VQ96_9ACTO|nr:hypothetical protein [Actinomyces bovis]SPT54185.1 Uncharacterised protein [Actinomyces bovis]VEG56586.1 Uncharacterised protein [Actinomyces israelii]
MAEHSNTALIAIGGGLVAVVGGICAILVTLQGSPFFTGALIGMGALLVIMIGVIIGITMSRRPRP